MSENGGNILSIGQLLECIRLSLLPDTPNLGEINEILRQWTQSPSSIPTSFEILQKSNNENLRFYSGWCFHFFLTRDFSVFSQENLTAMAGLFVNFILNNQNRLESSDTQAILFNLADLCAINPGFTEAVFKTFQPEITLLIIGILTNEIDSFPINSGLDRQAIEDFLKSLINTVYELFPLAPFNANWCKSFTSLFKFYQIPAKCIPFLDQIKLMSENEIFYSFFNDILENAFSLDYEDDEPTLILNTSLVQLAAMNAHNNPKDGTYVWRNIFDYSPFLLFHPSRIQFTEQVLSIFFGDLPNFFIEIESFRELVEGFCKYIMSYYSMMGGMIPYPQELFIKYATTLFSNLFNIYNQSNQIDLGTVIELSLNSFNTCPIKGQLKEFITSQPLSPAVFYAYSSYLFDPEDTREEGVKDAAVLSGIIEQIFSFPQVPFEALHFINCKSSCNFVSPYIQTIIQLCFNVMENNSMFAISVLKKLSLIHTEEMRKYAYDLSLSLLPTIRQFPLSQQKLLILLFFNILPDDEEKYGQIKNFILQDCAESIASPDSLFPCLEFIKSLYSESQQMKNEYSRLFMSNLLPQIFHEFLPVAMQPIDMIQNDLSNIIYEASKKHLFFPPTEDPAERQELLLNGDFYKEIFNWLFTMMEQDVCVGHFTVLKSFNIFPFGPVIHVISQIGLTQNDAIIVQMLDYIEFCFANKSEQLWPIFPLQFFLNFLNSLITGVVVATLKLLRRLRINSNEVKSVVFQAIISKMPSIEWMNSASGKCNNTIFQEAIVTIAAMINNDNGVFEIFVQQMCAFFPHINPEIPLFQNLFMLSQNNIDKLEKLTKSPYLLNIVRSINEIINTH